MKKGRMKKAVARKAVKATAKHTVRGTASKLLREPVRTATLLAIGAIAGVFAGRLLGRGASPATS